MCRHKTNTTYWYKNEESSKLIWLDMKANLEFKTLNKAQNIHKRFTQSAFDEIKFRTHFLPTEDINYTRDIKKSKMREALIKQLNYVSLIHSNMSIYHRFVCVELILIFFQYEIGETRHPEPRFLRFQKRNVQRKK